MSIAQRMRYAVNIWRRDGLRALLAALIVRSKLHASINKKFMWRSGFSYELRFWDDWIRTQGSPRPEKYQERVNPDEPFLERLIAYLPPQPEIRILDVGAGPLTNLGKKWAGKHLDITAVDALAEDYDRILAKYHVIPVVRTQKLEAEKITQRFPSNSFDFVYASNSIDHVYDPEQAILQMIEVVKKGCCVVLEHYENEAVNENYSGFHQWNFSQSAEGDFLISTKSTVLNMTLKYADICTITCKRIDPKMLATIILKKE